MWNRIGMKTTQKGESYEHNNKIYNFIGNLFNDGKWGTLSGLG